LRTDRKGGRSSATALVLTSLSPQGRRDAGPCRIQDQGQISKLLARLQRLGLITNLNQGAPAQGMPNAWILTPLGEQLANTIQLNGRDL
jgi:hypothetical protein